MVLKVRFLLKSQFNWYNHIICMEIFACSDTRKNRVISIRGPPGLQGLRRLKGDTGPQSPKCDEDDKGYFGYDGKTAMATDFIMANGKIIH